MSEVWAEYQRREAAVRWLQHVARESGGCIGALAARIGELEAEVQKREAAIAKLLPYAESKAEDLEEIADEADIGARHVLGRADVAVQARADALRAAAAVDEARRFLPLVPADVDGTAHEV